MLKSPFKRQSTLMEGCTEPTLLHGSLARAAESRLHKSCAVPEGFKENKWMVSHGQIMP